MTRIGQIIDIIGNKFKVIGGASRYELMIAQWHILPGTDERERPMFTIQPLQSTDGYKNHLKVYLEICSSKPLTSCGRYWKLKGLLFEEADHLNILRLEPACSFELLYDMNKRTGDMLLSNDLRAINCENEVGENGFLFAVNKSTREVVSVEYFGRTISVGDRVVSNGNHAIADGVPGTVVKVLFPTGDNQRLDIIVVKFTSSSEEETIQMMFDDLRP